MSDVIVLPLSGAMLLRQCVTQGVGKEKKNYEKMRKQTLCQCFI